MRRLTLILLILNTLTQVVQSQNLDFRLLPSNFKDGEIFQRLFDFNDHQFWAMEGISTMVDGKETYDYGMTQFNNKFEQTKRFNLPDNLPKYCYPFVFGNYIAFNGYNTSNSWNNTRKENFIVFTDREFNSVKEVNLKVQNENSCYMDNISLFLSEDSTKLITMVFVNEAVGKPGGPKLKAFIEVYDLKLEVVWQKSFYTSKYLGDDPQPIECKMLNDNSIVIISADKEGSSTKLRVCRFGDPESEPKITSRILKYPKMSFKTYMKDPETIILGGLLSNAETAKEMFYMVFDMNKNDFVVENKIKLDKNFADAYPDISKPLNKAWPLTSYKSTDYFVPWGEGSLMIFDGSYISDNVYLAWPITFISINKEGQVNWVKLIPRFLRTYDNDFASYSVFAQADKVQIFYGGDPETNGNMKIPGNGRIVLSRLGMFYSELDVSGNLTPGILVSKTSTEDLRIKTTGMLQINENVFVSGFTRFFNKKNILGGTDPCIIKIINK